MRLIFSVIDFLTLSSFLLAQKSPQSSFMCTEDANLMTSFHSSLQFNPLLSSFTCYQITTEGKISFCATTDKKTDDHSRELKLLYTFFCAIIGQKFFPILLRGSKRKFQRHFDFRKGQWPLLRRLNTNIYLSDHSALQRKEKFLTDCLLKEELQK